MADSACQRLAIRISRKGLGEISGLSHSVSSRGSSLGVAIAGMVIVSDLVNGNAGYALALIVLTAFALVDLVAAMMLPSASAGPRAFI